MPVLQDSLHYLAGVSVPPRRAETALHCPAMALELKQFKKYRYM